MSDFEDGGEVLPFPRVPLPGPIDPPSWPRPAPEPAPRPEPEPAGAPGMPQMPGVETMAPPLHLTMPGVLEALNLGDAEGVFVPPAPEDPQNPTRRDAAATALAVMVALSVAAANHLWQVGAVLRARAKQRRAAADKAASKGVLSSGPGRGRAGGAGPGPLGRGRSGGGGSRSSGGGRAKSPTGGRVGGGSGKPSGPSKGLSGLLGGSGSSRPGKASGKGRGGAKGRSKGPGSKGPGSKGRGGAKTPGTKTTTKGGTTSGAGRPRGGRTAGKGPGGAAAGRKRLGQRPGPKQLPRGGTSGKGTGPKGAGGRRQDAKRPGGRGPSGAGGRASFGGSQWWRRKRAEWRTAGRDGSRRSRARRPGPEAGRAGTRGAWPPPPNWQGDRWQEGMRPPPAADKTVTIRVERMDQQHQEQRRPPVAGGRAALPPGPAGGPDKEEDTVHMARTGTQYRDAELTVYDVIDADADMAAEIADGAVMAGATAEGCDQLFTRLERLYAEVTSLQVPGTLVNRIRDLMQQTATVRDCAQAVAEGLPRAAEAIGTAGTNAAARHKPLADAVRDAGHARPAERDYHNE